MARVAVVTGGTRGIGEAISVGLKEAGYNVAAVYAGNDEKAREFTERTGIAAFKWDVSDFEACKEGVAKVEAELGPVEIVVNNAGITRDGVLHRMSFEQWNDVIETNLTSCFNMCRNVIDGMRERGFGRIVNIGSINGQAGPVRPGQLRRRQVRHPRLHQGAGPGRCRQGDHRQRHRARLHRHRHGPRRAAERAGEDRRQGPGRPSRQGVARSPAACCSWSPTRAASSPARPCRSTAASTCTDRNSEKLKKAPWLGHWPGGT